MVFSLPVLIDLKNVATKINVTLALFEAMPWREGEP
jgi:hypothetical protein